MIRNLFVLIICLFFAKPLRSQDLTGSWEGYMEGERLEVNMIMKKKELCGYTSDYVLREPSSYCKAYFRGWFDEQAHVWILVGTSFIENSGNHVLMVLRLWNNHANDSLQGTVELKSSTPSLLSLGRSRVELKRISPHPIRLPNVFFDCSPVIRRPDSVSAPKIATIKARPTLSVADVKEKKTIQHPVAIKPTVKKAPQLTATANKVKTLHADSTRVMADNHLQVTTPLRRDIIEKKLKERKNTTLSHIVVQEKNIKLAVYDNGTVDNDTVSIFYNGKLIASKQKLSEKALDINLELDENTRYHEIVMYAENLGSIPPNTALIVVTAGSKRYELHSSSSFTENAVLVFEYVAPAK